MRALSEICILWVEPICPKPMRSIWMSLILIPIAFSLSAQTSFFDSLELLLPDLPDSRKYAVYQRLRGALEGFEDREKRRARLYLCRPAGRLLAGIPEPAG